MERITHEYGLPVNKLVIKTEDYEILRSFLEPVGVELPISIYHPDTDTYEISVLNDLFDWCKLAPTKTVGWALEVSRNGIETRERRQRGLLSR